MTQKIPVPGGKQCSKCGLETTWRAAERLGFPDPFPMGQRSNVLGFQKVTFCGHMATSQNPHDRWKVPVFLYTRGGFPPIQQHPETCQIPALPLYPFPPDHVFGWSAWHLLNGSLGFWEVSGRTGVRAPDPRPSSGASCRGPCLSLWTWLHCLFLLKNLGWGHFFPHFLKWPGGRVTGGKRQGECLQHIPSSKNCNSFSLNETQPPVVGDVCGMNHISWTAPDHAR